MQEMVNYYPGYKDLLGFSKMRCIEIDKKAVAKSSKVIYTSEWAAQSAIRSYDLPSEKIHIIPFGANLDYIPLREEILSIRKGYSEVIKLLFVGVDWFRKGGEIAFQTTVELNKRGVNTELIICGCIPPKHIQHEKLRIVGFLDKNNSEHTLKLEKLYKEATIFFLPTRFECSGIVFAEAAAYGLPIIATATGGVATYVANGVNGYILPPESGYVKYTDIIQSIYRNQKDYFLLCENSRNKFESELNWDSFANNVRKIIKGIENKRC
jgi:glycosyltransferase involved in cell wall biosynthesis